MSADGDKINLILKNEANSQTKYIFNRTIEHNLGYSTMYALF